MSNCEGIEVSMKLTPPRRRASLTMTSHNTKDVKSNSKNVIDVDNHQSFPSSSEEVPQVPPTIDALSTSKAFDVYEFIESPPKLTKRKLKQPAKKTKREVKKKIEKQVIRDMLRINNEIKLLKEKTEETKIKIKSRKSIDVKMKTTEE